MQVQKVKGVRQDFQDWMDQKEVPDFQDYRHRKAYLGVLAFLDLQEHLEPQARCIMLYVADIVFLLSTAFSFIRLWTTLKLKIKELAHGCVSRELAQEFEMTL